LFILQCPCIGSYSVPTYCSCGVLYLLWFCGRMDYVLVTVTFPIQVLLRLCILNLLVSQIVYHSSLFSVPFIPLSYDQTVPKTQRKSNSMDQSPFPEPHTDWASQEIIRLSWKPNVHYLITNSPPLAPFPSQLHPLHTLALRFTLILYYRLHKGLRRCVHISFSGISLASVLSVNFTCNSWS